MNGVDFKYFRRVNKFTQAEAAKYFDCDQSFISKIEQGKNKIPDSFMSKIGVDKSLDSTMFSCLTKTDAPYTINQEHIGAPYYDVDFIGGFDIATNDQTSNPAYHIQFQAYNNADCWVNITGHSMEPQISHGDLIALKKIEDWKTYLLYGETYAVVTDEYRTVKKVRRSNISDDFLRLVPTNSDYDEQDISKSIIRSVYQVLGCAKKIF